MKYLKKLVLLFCITIVTSVVLPTKAFSEEYMKLEDPYTFTVGDMLAYFLNVSWQVARGQSKTNPDELDMQIFYFQKAKKIGVIIFGNSSKFLVAKEQTEGLVSVLMSLVKYGSERFLPKVNLTRKDLYVTYGYNDKPILVMEDGECIVPAAAGEK